MGNGNKNDDAAAADELNEQETTPEADDQDVEDLGVTDDEAEDVQGGAKSLGQDMDPY